MVVKFAEMDADSGFLHRDTFSPGVPVLDYVSQVSGYILLYISANIYVVGNFANISAYVVWRCCAKYFDGLVR